MTTHDIEAQASRVEDREAEFWDQKAREKSDEELLRDKVKSEPLDECRKRLLGDLSGKRVLDVGCGTGLWTMYLAACGAEVWAIDISPESVAVTMRRARLNQVCDSVHGSVMSAMEMSFPDGYFDVVHGQDIIHHLDADRFGSEINRVLAPHGHAVFSENCANNPLLMFARDNICGRFGVPKWSSDDEYPLTRERLARFAQSFARIEVRFPEFVCFHYVDAKLFGYRNKFVTSVCHGLDRLLYRLIPAIRQYSYRQVIYLRK
jgi:2-polyprenyl-3-methyl-5-hydroxy-6-metoxy-1,4-benzoquinol methylase